MGDGGPGRGNTLAADGAGCVLPRKTDQGGHVAEGAVQMRLDHMEHKAHRGGGIEGRAALFKKLHAHGRGDPVG